MPNFMAVCEDNGDCSELRAEHLEQHLAYVETIMDRISVAGPLREEGDSQVGASCFLYSGSSLQAVKPLLEKDPYYQAGIYRSVRWFSFIPAAGEWVGGRNW